MLRYLQFFALQTNFFLALRGGIGMPDGPGCHRSAGPAHVSLLPSPGSVKLEELLRIYVTSLQDDT
jgi:hypothetical protein